MTGLSRLGANPVGLEALLIEVATFAVQAIPGADGASLALSQEDLATTVVATAEFVRRVDDIQYSLGEGPCISAAEQARTVVSGSLGTDPRWPRFSKGVAGLSVNSTVSLPLITSGQVVGAINVYAHQEHAFDGWAATRRAIRRPRRHRRPERPGPRPGPPARRIAEGCPDPRDH